MEQDGMDECSGSLGRSVYVFDLEDTEDPAT